VLHLLLIQSVMSVTKINEFTIGCFLYMPMLFYLCSLACTCLTPPTDAMLQLFGFAHGGPFGHFLHKILDYIFKGKKDTKTIAKKVYCL